MFDAKEKALEWSGFGCTEIKDMCIRFSEFLNPIEIAWLLDSL
ncbi:hypothetical protein JCM17380_36990 [Desulfosporosinus burensis]